MKKLTIYEIAKKAKVSIATISRAMNTRTRHKVAPVTLEKIDRLIEESGYTPNVAARNLSQSASRTIGVVVPQIYGLFLSDYYSKVLSGVSDALIGSEYQFKLVMLSPDLSPWDLHDFKYGEGVDGLVVTHWPKYFSNKNFFQKLKIPSAIISDMEKGVQTHRVSCDNNQGGELAAEYLMKKGHKKIAVLTGPKWSNDSFLRLNSFKNRLKESGVSLDASLVVSANYQEEDAFAKMRKLARSKKKFTALFCLNDSMAIGAIKGLQEEGLKCPQDISVIGFDDERRASFENPLLTTVHQPVYEIAKGATQLLVSDLQQRKEGRKKYLEQVFPVYLVERHSVRKV